MSKDTKRKAVIYCRVSDPKQAKTRGDGLNSQETRCREYAKHKGYEVEEVFKDDVSGGIASRPGMKAMLAFLRKQRTDPRMVLIDDVSRLARGLSAHIELRASIIKAGGILESPTLEFGEDADSELHEYILATVAQHQRKKNAEQTLNRMKARMMNGYWVFQAPVAYRYERVTGRGKVLVRNEPLASIVQEALEGYASGRFQIQAEVKRFLESFPEYPRDRTGEVRAQRITEILTRVVYAGYVESLNWEVSLRPAQHDALISFETYQKIQRRLHGNAKAPARADLNKDFPMRGFVVCGDCGNPLTACWSKGKNKRHPYYLCHKKGCKSYGKSIRRDALEGEFEALLHQISPAKKLVNKAGKMFKLYWDHIGNHQKQRKQSLEAELVKIDRKTEQLLDRILDTDSSTIISAYEKRIKKTGG